MSHTPGPWEARPDEFGEPHRACCAVWTADGQVVAYVPIFTGDKRGDMPYEANANLMGAAPDLLAALERLYVETADYITINHLGPVHHNMAMQMARDALVKAGSSRAPASAEPCGAAAC